MDALNDTKVSHLIPNIVSEIMFGYESLTDEQIISKIKGLNYKIIRWIAVHHPDNSIRKLLFEQTNVKVGRDAVLNINLIIADNYEPLVEIGDRVAVGPNVTIIAVSFPNNSALVENKYVKEKLLKKSKVLIEDDAWIGANAIILPGAQIGKGAIIGAGSIITEEVPPHSIVAGVPAKVIRILPSDRTE